MAAFTRSGARKASEIVMLTFRMLHRSRLAMLSAFAFASARSSSSQRRPKWRARGILPRKAYAGGPSRPVAHETFGIRAIVGMEGGDAPAFDLGNVNRH